MIRIFRLPVLGFALLLCAVAAGCDRSQPLAEPTSSPPDEATVASTGTVTIEIQSADGVQSYEVDDVADGTTLETVMRGCSDAKAQISGSGTTAFVTQIGDVKTSAAEGWTFEVDGEWADSGVGSTLLHPPTTVTWVFGGFDSAKSEK